MIATKKRSEKYMTIYVPQKGYRHDDFTAELYLTFEEHIIPILLTQFFTTKITNFPNSYYESCINETPNVLRQHSKRSKKEK